MTARIILATPAPAAHQQATAAEHLGGVDVATTWVSATDLAAPGREHVDLDDTDGLWLLDPPPPGLHEPMSTLLSRAQAHGIPAIVTGGPAPPARPGYDERVAWLVAAASHRERARAEAVPRPYPQAQRGPGHRWWKPLLSIPGVMLVFTVLALTLGLVFYAFGAVSTSGAPEATDPMTSLMLNLVLGCGIPAAVLGIWAVHWRGPWRVLSLRQQLRWGWLLRTFAWLLPLWVAYLGLTWVVYGQEAGPPERRWVALSLIALLTTPLQCAGEELIFRGAIVQAVGSWFSRPWPAFAVSTAVSTALFALAHGSLDPWVLLDIGSLGLGACYLTWRTGGLESAIALHLVNNWLIIGSGIAFGGLQTSYVDTDTTGSPLGSLASIAAVAAACALVDWRAREAGIAPKEWPAPALG